jgi:tetratricopeptide (TPR) repeat protein
MSHVKHLMVCGTLASVMLSFGATARAKDEAQVRALTVRPAVLYRTQGNALVAGVRIPALSELPLDGRRPNYTDGSGVSYRPILWGQDQPGAWVRQADLVSIPQPRPRIGDLPPLIARQPIGIQRAWLAIEAATQENSRISPPLPQPYLARAELWAMVSNYDAAIDDLLTASVLSRKRQATTADQVELLKRLEGLLAKHAQTPRPQYRGDSSSHFQAGYEAYHEGRLDDALRRFDAAIQYDPGDMVLWYYRALTNKRLLNDSAAEHDITMAVYLERQEQRSLGPHQWTRLFTRVQGPLRNWMEAYRSGVTPGV